MQALSLTVTRFNEQYQDTLTDRHGLVILAIKYYVTANKVDSFNVSDIREYFNLESVWGYYASSNRKFARILADIARLDFCNPLGVGRYVPTTRIKVFSATYDSILKELFASLVSS